MREMEIKVSTNLPVNKMNKIPTKNQLWQPPWGAKTCLLWHFMSMLQNFTASLNSVPGRRCALWAPSASSRASPSRRRQGRTRGSSCALPCWSGKSVVTYMVQARQAQNSKYPVKFYHFTYEVIWSFKKMSFLRNLSECNARKCSARKSFTNGCCAV